MTEPRPDGHFGICVDKDDQHVTVDLSGTLDQETACLVALWLTPMVLVEPARTVNIDLTLVTSVTADGLGVLVDLIELAHHRHCDVQVIAGTDGHLYPLWLIVPD
jgi:anti-anti-sigma factor